MSPKITTSKAILQFLREHPGWVLQFCRGIRGVNWWQLRDGPRGERAIPCHGTAGKAASRKLFGHLGDVHGRVDTYRLNPL